MGLYMNELSKHSKLVHDFLECSSDLFSKSLVHSSQIAEFAEIIANALIRGNKVIWCGNGGSAGDAQHLSAELVGSYKISRPAFASIAITTDTSALTAIANDFGYEHVFSRQIQAIGQRGDVLVALSTSGKSPSILNAIQIANLQGLKTIFLTSTKYTGDHSKLVLKIDSTLTEHIQHLHLAIGHVMCEIVESMLADQQIDT
jgi:D-sedoheptulose 7-phosphate isomerase